MPALEPVEAWRVVASPAALDAAVWLSAGIDVFRIAPDEALALGAVGVEVDGDPEAIIEPESGFSVALLTADDELAVREHTEWDIEEACPIAQGKIAGVPAKLIRGDPSILLVQTAHADELRRRLGW